MYVYFLLGKVLNHATKVKISNHVTGTLISVAGDGL